jgi:ketosteroid isomerase-like protein
MYRSLVRRRVETVFASLSEGDYASVLPGLHPKVHHRFAGDHPLGGERHTRDAVERWFQRLFRLFSLDFDVERIVVSGPPWRLLITVEWAARVTPVVGDTYVNRGAHVLRMQRFRVTELHAYEDSQAVAAACREMAEQGVDEAAAPPITT